MDFSEMNKELFWVILIGAALVTGGTGIYHIGKFFLVTNLLQDLKEGIILLATSILSVFVFLPITGAFLFEVRNKLARSGLKPK